jgi:hypothetical protein
MIGIGDDELEFVVDGGMEGALIDELRLAKLTLGKTWGERGSESYILRPLPTGQIVVAEEYAGQRTTVACA